ncbi:MAG: DUF503 domain-containing protein [Chloroflexi bacterium]|nr:DUF503 domain-containing protein [Chloroflexota bacterium]
MHIVTLTLFLNLPGVYSLKEKRSVLKGLLARLHKEFNVSAAEVDHHDAWGSAVIGCALVSNDPGRGQRVMQTLAGWVEAHRPDVDVDDYQIEVR